MAQVRKRRMPAEDKAFGTDKRGDEMPDWVADKQARLAKDTRGQGGTGGRGESQSGGRAGYAREE